MSIWQEDCKARYLLNKGGKENHLENAWRNVCAGAIWGHHHVGRERSIESLARAAVNVGFDIFQMEEPCPVGNRCVLPNILASQQQDEE